MRSSPWQAYAKALHYREMEFRSEPHVEAAIESLISINNQLQQPDAAQGVLSYSQQQHQARARLGHSVLRASANLNVTSRR